jgi:hypothetical protein
MLSVRCRLLLTELSLFLSVVSPPRDLAAVAVAMGHLELT